jgi:hypothetical protein
VKNKNTWGKLIVKTTVRLRLIDSPSLRNGLASSNPADPPPPRTRFVGAVATDGHCTYVPGSRSPRPIGARHHFSIRPFDLMSHNANESHHTPAAPANPVFCAGLMDEACAKSSRPGESHPRPLSEPYVNLSIHTALRIQLLRHHPRLQLENSSGLVRAHVSQSFRASV